MYVVGFNTFRLIKKLVISNMKQLRFDGKVAVVTGAGGGLGREYALLFAKRGASVVVNDLGGSPRGVGSAKSAADDVVSEITRFNGKAVANYDSVENGASIIKTALDCFGRIDILVNNAGILRDRTFGRMTDEEWDLIYKVHLRGAYSCTRAAWEHFKNQNYGKIIFTSSTSGIFGNYGQSNYGAAKAALIGLSNTLAAEGSRYGIFCNVIVPVAGSRLTEDLMPPEIFEELKPKYVAPVVVWLCHEDCADNGSVLEAAGGFVAKFQWQRSKGLVLRQSNTEMSPETVRDNWNSICNMNNAVQPSSNAEETSMIIEQIQSANTDVLDDTEYDQLNPEAVMRTKIPPLEYRYVPKDVILYALSVGVGTQNPSDLKFIYEGHADFVVLPTFGVIIGTDALFRSGLFSGDLKALGPKFDVTKILNGEHYLEIRSPLQADGVLDNRVSIVDVVDKGSGAVIVYEVNSYSGGSHVLRSQGLIFLVGCGKFGGKRSSAEIVPLGIKPNRQPDAVTREKIGVDLAALYRLTGDTNPLHIDPNFAAMAGFETPILHGFCSYGIVGRHVLRVFGDNDPKKIKAIKARFVKPVIPGQTLEFEMWREGNRIHFQAKIVETGQLALSGGYVDLTDVVPLQSKLKGGDTETKEKKLLFNKVNADDRLQSDMLFETIQQILPTKNDISKAINTVILFVILNKNVPVRHWVVDFTKTPGEITLAEDDGVKGNCSVTMEDTDLIEVASGNLNPQTAFFGGKMKITGNIMLLMKMLSLLKTEAAKL